MNIRPMNALSISFSPGYNISRQELQYVSTMQVNQDTKYIFASLNQKTASFTFRLNYTFSPELSLEYYGQPFISAGKYTNYKRITTPNANKFADRFYNFTNGEISFNATDNRYSVDEDMNGNEDYSFDNLNFNFKQFRSNLVIRWEYSPGSTLFLVWSQGRTGSVSDGSFSYKNDMKDLFGIQPHDVFLIKFSYWFTL
jgi:hypothetical protein